MLAIINELYEGNKGYCKQKKTTIKSHYKYKRTLTELRLITTTFPFLCRSCLNQMEKQLQYDAVLLTSSFADNHVVA